MDSMVDFVKPKMIPVVKNGLKWLCWYLWQFTVSECLYKFNIMSNDVEKYCNFSWLYFSSDHKKKPKYIILFKRVFFCMCFYLPRDSEKHIVAPASSKNLIYHHTIRTKISNANLVQISLLKLFPKIYAVVVVFW